MPMRGAGALLLPVECDGRHSATSRRTVTGIFSGPSCAAVSSLRAALLPRLDPRVFSSPTPMFRSRGK